MTEKQAKTTALFLLAAVYQGLELVLDSFSPSLQDQGFQRELKEARALLSLEDLKVPSHLACL